MLSKTSRDLSNCSEKTLDRTTKHESLKGTERKSMTTQELMNRLADFGDNFTERKPRVLMPATFARPLSHSPIRFLRTAQRSVFAVVVPSSANRPCFSGPAYIRRGSEIVQASQEIPPSPRMNLNTRVSNQSSKKAGVSPAVVDPHFAAN